MPVHTAHTVAAAHAGVQLSDEDGDGDSSGGGGHYDFDDRNVFSYGRPLSSYEHGLATAVVQRYYAAAKRADGTAACAAMAPSLARATATEYGQGSGALALPGRTCSAVGSALFARLHDRLNAESAGLSVGVVRARGNEADAVISAGGEPWPRHYLRLRRIGRAWRVDMLQEAELP